MYVHLSKRIDEWLNTLEFTISKEAHEEIPQEDNITFDDMPSIFTNLVECALEDDPL